MLVFRVMYRLYPLRIGVLIEDGVAVRWKSSHFERFNTQFVFLSEDGNVEFYYFTPFHVLTDMKMHQRVYWIRPFDNDLGFHYEEKDRVLWNTSYRMLARYHPDQRY